MRGDPEETFGKILGVIGQKKLLYQPVEFDEIDSPLGRAMFEVGQVLVNSKGEVNEEIGKRLQTQLCGLERLDAIKGLRVYWAKAGFNVGIAIQWDTDSPTWVPAVAECIKEYRKWVNATQKNFALALLNEDMEVGPAWRAHKAAAEEDKGEFIQPYARNYGV